MTQTQRLIVLQFLKTTHDTAARHREQFLIGQDVDASLRAITETAARQFFRMALRFPKDCDLNDLNIRSPARWAVREQES